MLVSLIGYAVLAQAKFDFYHFAPYDKSIPKPDTILSRGPGERHSTFFEQEQVVQALVQAAPNRVRRFDYGKSTEGRPLRILAISTPENIAKLEQYRTQMASVAVSAAAPSADLPVFVWINECIHGNETASFESGMWLAYNLIASRNPEIESALKNAIVIYNPVYNPDGHERFTVWYNSIFRSDPNSDAYEHNEPRIVYGRTNHFRFDMNRDRVAFSQAETRQEVAEFLKWNPQVYADQHGQVETYFFPPPAQAFNINVGRERVDKWTTVLGKATGKSFDTYGWPYFVRETFDFYYPGYLDTWTTLSGAIGLTHETDGGRNIQIERRDGSLLTLRDGMAKHFTSALAVIQESARNRAGLLDSFAAYKRDAMSGKHAGKFQRVVLTSSDERPLARLKEQLSRAGISAYFAQSFKQPDTHDYWSPKQGEASFPGGSLVVDMAQSQGPLAKSLLEPGSDFEPEFVKEQLRRKALQDQKEQYPGSDGTEFYDLTGWSLPYAYNLKAWWCESAPKLQPYVQTKTPTRLSKSAVGYVVEYSDQEDALAIFDLMSKGIRVSLISKETKIDGRTLNPGSFLIMNARNDDNLFERLSPVLSSLKVHSLTTSYPDSGRNGPGSESVQTLRKPEIAMVFGDGDDITNFGSVWYLMDKVFKLPFTAIGKRDLSGDLSRYTCVVCPSGNYPSISPSLKSWVEGGGCLVVLGSPRWIIGTSGVPLEAGKDTGDLPGSIVQAELDGRYFLSYGYGTASDGKSKIAVPVEGNRFFKKREEGGGAVVFGSDEKEVRTLSGWAWPNDTDAALANCVYVQDQPMGRGRIIVFTQDPTSRAMWPGLNKLLLNSMLFGPS